MANFEQNQKTLVEKAGSPKTEPEIQEENPIPTKYRNLDSEMLEEMWQPKQFLDPEKRAEATKQRNDAIAWLKQKEETGSQTTQRQASEQMRIEQIRSDLGLQAQNENNQSEASVEPLEKFGDQVAKEKLEQLLSQREKEKGKPGFFKEVLESASKDTVHLVGTLVSYINHRKRNANYPVNSGYKEAWQEAIQEGSLEHRQENDWIYRGNMPEKGKKTITRGSLNINVNPDVVKQLDDLIKSGIIDANYKFGDPDSPTSADSRHDAVTIYFFEEPSQEAYSALSKLANESFRGNDLLGKKISEGFYMSEIGSISDGHARKFLMDVEAINPEIAKGMKGFLTGRDDRVAMSEAQFYSAKEVLNLYGYNIDYDSQKGINLNRLEKSSK
jgi:hypothetical protein